MASAKSSYQEAERDIELMMGMRVGHSNLHRLVQRSEIPEGQSQKNIESLSVDGGKVRLRTKEQGPCEWRDYKAVSLHNSVCGAYFQDNEALIAWVQRQPLSSMVTCVGDGHDGVWNIMKCLAPNSKRRSCSRLVSFDRKSLQDGQVPSLLRGVESLVMVRIS